MKKINNFMDTAPYWQVYILGAFLTSLLTYCMFSYFLIGDNPYTKLVIIKIAIAFGLFFGLLICLTTNMARKSQKFWNACKELESKVDAANTKHEMDILFDTDFVELTKLAQGSPHYGELKTLRAVMRTKYKFMK